MASAKPISYYIRELPKRDLCSPPHPAKPRSLRNFPCNQRAPAELHDSSREGDLPGLGPIVGPGQDIEQVSNSVTKRGVRRGGPKCSVISVPKELFCPEMTSEQFLISARRWVVRHLFGGCHSSCGICGVMGHPAFLLAGAGGGGRCGVGGLGSQGHVFAAEQAEAARLQCFPSN